MAVITVNSSQSLMKAVSAAHDGDVIKLAAGTYSGVVLSGTNFTKNVTITSADTTRPAVLTDLMVSKSKGLTFQGLDLTNTQNADLPFQIVGSSNIVLDHLDVMGTGNSVAALNARLMIIRGSTNVQVTNSEFAYGWHGLSMLNNKQVNIADNYFHDLRTDGVRGGGNSNLTIKANVFTNFHPTATDHPDAIQLWTVNTSAGSSNITIDENIVYRGSGSTIQGIFLRDTSGNMPFSNVSITNNVIEGARYNGISVDGALNGTIANNIVQAFSDQPSGIRLGNATGVSVSNNQTTQFFTSLKSMVGQYGNKLIGVASDGGASTIGAWLKSHTAFSTAWQSSDPAVLYNLLHLSGGSTPPTGGSTSAGTTAKMALAPASAMAMTASTLAIDTQDDQSALATASLQIAGDTDDLSGQDQDTGSGAADEADATLLTQPGAEHIDTAANVLDLATFDIVETDDLPPADNDETLLLSDDMIAAEAAAVEAGMNVVTVNADVQGRIHATEAADLFRISTNGHIEADGRAIIVGFESGVDKIIVADEQADASQDGAQAMNFIGLADFTGKAGEIRYFDGARGVTVQADMNGDTIVDLEFSLRDVHAVSVKDFIL